MFKVGDKVKIKKDLTGTNKHTFLVKEMLKYASKESVVVSVRKAFDREKKKFHIIRLAIDNREWAWEEDSFVNFGEWD